MAEMAGLRGWRHGTARHRRRDDWSEFFPECGWQTRSRHCDCFVNSPKQTEGTRLLSIPLFSISPDSHLTVSQSAQMALSTLTPTMATTAHFLGDRELAPNGRAKLHWQGPKSPSWGLPRNQALTCVLSGRQQGAGLKAEADRKGDKSAPGDSVTQNGPPSSLWRGIRPRTVDNSGTSAIDGRCPGSLTGDHVAPPSRTTSITGRLCAPGGLVTS